MPQQIYLKQYHEAHLRVKVSAKALDNLKEKGGVEMASDYMMVVPERVKVVKVINEIAGDEVEYELAVDPSGMAFRRRLGSIEDADWLPCSHHITIVRDLMARGGTLGAVLGREWNVIVPAGGGTWRAYPD